jgi:hypothetical protein
MKSSGQKSSGPEPEDFIQPRQSYGMRHVPLVAHPCFRVHLCGAIRHGGARSWGDGTKPQQDEVIA